MIRRVLAHDRAREAARRTRRFYRIASAIVMSAVTLHGGWLLWRWIAS